MPLRPTAPPRLGGAPKRGTGAGAFSLRVRRLRRHTGRGGRLPPALDLESRCPSGRVACIGGERDADGRSLITRIQPVRVEHADSPGAAASVSIEQCAPPGWLGTVHTHIARSETGPFAGFSASDREVIFQWWKRWQTDGTFCVLYSEGAGHCEMDGVAAPRWRRDQMILRY